MEDNKKVLEFKNYFIIQFVSSLHHSTIFFFFFNKSLNESYKGGWIQNMKHGNGLFSFKDGSTYEVWRFVVFLVT